MWLRRFERATPVRRPLRRSAHGPIIRALSSLALLGLVCLLPLAAGADGGLSGAIGFARAIMLIIAAGMAVGAAITYAWYKVVGKKWVWLFYPVIVAVILGGLWGYQYMA